MLETPTVPNAPATNHARAILPLGRIFRHGASDPHLPSLESSWTKCARSNWLHGCEPGMRSRHHQHGHHRNKRKTRLCCRALHQKPWHTANLPGEMVASAQESGAAWQVPAKRSPYFERVAKPRTARIRLSQHPLLLMRRTRAPGAPVIWIDATPPWRTTQSIQPPTALLAAQNMLVPIWPPIHIHATSQLHESLRSIIRKNNGRDTTDHMKSQKCHRVS